MYSSDDSRSFSSRLHALHAMKAECVGDCLMEFDESLLFLHDKVLDHERLVRKLAELRTLRAVRPLSKCRFDESFVVSDDEDHICSNRIPLR